MPVTREIALFDVVVLSAPADGVAAGERGRVVEIFDDRTAMVELRTPPSELDLDRIVVAPFDRLQVVVDSAG